MSFFDKLKQGLSKTKQGFMNQVDTVLASFGVVDEALLEELEDALISADLGVSTTMTIMSNLRSRIKSDKVTKPQAIRGLIQDEIKKLLDKGQHGLDINKTPVVITIIGVNGVGKTTSIGKITNLFKKNNKKVLIAAADTFRAAAIDQLAIWAERTNTEMIRQSEGSDPSSVIYDACQAAKAQKADVLICDTAGRLHNKKHLMDELRKMSKVIDRELPNFRRETLLVLDATTGQNAVSQAKSFSEVADVSGIILTKLDGTARGGIVVSISNELGIPVRLIGVGEGLDDMQPFNSDDFAKALFE